MFVIYKVLITCLGNICRSPTAEYLLNRAIETTELKSKIEITSAGLINPGNMASGFVRSILGDEMGIVSIQEHRSRVATQKMLSESDLVLPMGISELEGILSISPHPNAHLYMDFVYGTLGGEVEDPYGGPIDEYRKMVSLIDITVQPWVEKMEKILKQGV